MPCMKKFNAGDIKMINRAIPRTSLTLALIIAVTVWPSFLLLALDVYGLQGWLRECRVWHEPPGASVLAVLLFASAVVIVCLLNNIKCSTRLRRSIRNMPLLDDRKIAVLRKTLPDLATVTLRVYPCDVPQAFTVGWCTPVIVLSSWLLENLDEQEITATVAHELAHIRHRDTLLMFWVHSLCPGGFGLRPLRRQIRQLTVLIENRADTTGAFLTGNPLALASALTKVGKHLTSPRFAPVLSLTGNGNASLLRQRVIMLLGEHEPIFRFNRGAALLLAAFLTGTAYLIAYAYELPCVGLQCDLKTMTRPQPAVSH